MTYSIVARDAETGEIGVAVASHAFAAGRDVAFARPGVGAAATQGVPEAGHPERLLDALESGCDAQQALECLRAGDPAGFWEAYCGSSPCSPDSAGRLLFLTVCGRIMSE